MGSPYVPIKAHSTRPTDAIGREHRQVDAKGSCAREREPRRKRATTGLGGELTSHRDRDGGAFASEAAIRRSCSRIAAFFQSGSRYQTPGSVVDGLQLGAACYWVTLRGGS
jgi:hypothetical protein